ncbi:hypothetical protein ACF0H5_020654 [Mactra antiquata]
MDDSKQVTQNISDNANDDVNDDVTPPSKSCAESSEVDIILAGSSSSSSSSLGTPSLYPDVQNGIQREDTDCTIENLMPEEEVQEHNRRLEEVVNQLQKQREDYETWENNLNKRRMLVYDRLKALGRFHKDRMHVYNSFKDYIDGISSSASNKSDGMK